MKKIRLFLAVICVVFCLATTAYVAQSTPVLAASSTTSSKIDASKLKIMLSATKYNYNGRERKPKVSVTYKGKTVSADNFTVKYSSGRKLPGTYKVTVTLKGKYTGKKTLKYKIAVETPDVKVASGTNSIKLSWEKSAKAKGYFVYNEDGDRIAKTEKTTYTVKDLKAGRRYTFYVVAYTKIGDKTYKSSDAVVETATKPVISGSKTLYIGQNKTFKATAKGKISWSSSDKSIAKVNSEGKVTALKAGTVTIKAKANGVTASYKVTIKKPTIKLNKSYLELDINESAKLKATVTPSSMKVKWKSSDTDIVEVYSNGEIVPISEGDAIVTAIGTYGGKTYKKTCELVVITQTDNELEEIFLLSEGAIALFEGETYSLSYTAYPTYILNQPFYWESSNDEIVSVDNYGNIVAKSCGYATVSAHSKNKEYTSSCEVMVKSNPIISCRDFPLHLYSYDEKEYLGKLVTNKYDSDSIWNEYGTYGSKYQSKSIWNEYGDYGSPYRSTSAFNPYASQPPKIVTNSGKIIGYLSANEFKTNGYTILQLERELKRMGQ